MNRHINFEYPITLDKNAHEDYRRAGIIFRNYVLREEYSKVGFSVAEVTVDDYTLARNLSELGSERCECLIDHLGSSEIRDAIYDSVSLCALNLLEEGYTRYPWGYGGNVFHDTWELNGGIKSETDRLLEKLKNFGVEQVRLGVELEFGLPEEAIVGFDRWKEVRFSLINSLEFSIASGLNVDNAKRKLDEIKRFQPRDFLMLDMIELDNETRDILEPLFGLSLDGEGYYDGKGCLELKLAHCDITEFYERFERVQLALIRKVKKYGLALTEAPNCHLNYSFWDSKGNLLDSTHPDYETKGKIIVEGMTRGVSDCLPLIASGSILRQKIINHSLGCNNDRDGYLRISSGRCELRPVETHFEVMNIPVLAGVLEAFSCSESDRYSDDFKQGEIVRCGRFRKTEDILKVLLHTLSNSVIQDDGRFIVPSDYVRAKSRELAYDMRMIDVEPEKTFLSAFSDPADYSDGILEFLSETRIVEDEGSFRLVFPRNDPRGYKITTPEINMDGIPEEMANRIRNGEDVNDMRDEVLVYLCIGNRMPRRSLDYIIDVDYLEENIWLVSLDKRVVVADGYELGEEFLFDDSRQEERVLFTKIEKMKNSDLLKRQVSEELRNGIIDAVDRKYPKPLTIKDISHDTALEYAAMIVAAIKSGAVEDYGGKNVTVSMPINATTLLSSSSINEIELGSISGIMLLLASSRLKLSMRDTESLHEYLQNEILVSSNRSEYYFSSLGLNMPRVLMHFIQEGNFTEATELVEYYREFYERDVIEEMGEIDRTLSQRKKEPPIPDGWQMGL